MTTNAAAIWTALSQSETPPAVALLPAPATILIWRHDLTPSFRTLEKSNCNSCGRPGKASLSASYAPRLAQTLATSLAFRLRGNGDALQDIDC